MVVLEKMMAALVSVNVQLPVSILFLAWGKERRTCFEGRLLLFVLVCAITLYLDFFRCEWLKITGELSLSYPVYVLILAMLVAFSFKMSIQAALFYAVTGYLVQNLQFNIRGVLLSCFFDGKLNIEFYLASMVVIAVLFVILYHPVSQIDKNMELEDGFQVVFGVSSLVVVWLLSSLAGEGEERGVVLGLYAFLLDVALLLILIGGYARLRFLQEKSVVEQLLNSQKKQQKLSEETMEIMNMKFHDLKHYVMGAKEEIEEAHKEEIINAISVYDQISDSGNPALDVLLTEKSFVCQNREIAFTYMVDGAALDFMEKSDLYSFLANALDNAIEACEEIEERKRRFVTLKIVEVAGMASIVVKNECERKLELVNGLPVTTKADKSVHGYGTKSMRWVVQKYKGTLLFAEEEGCVCLSALFPKM